METAPNAARTVALTCAAMVAFAANSVLCRQALGSRSIDAATFSAVRLLSGAAILFAVVSLRRSRRSVMIGGRWTSAVVMFLYAIPFSFAFNSLDAGTGALILFGSVQVTMILAALWSGERPRLLEWVGLCTAAGGLLYLYFDGLETPSLRGAGLMSLAGVCWGLYTLLGRSARQPLAETAGNFIRTAPLALVLVMLAPGFVSM
ncbi:MAG: EamA family transporter, partial [Planctomycetaceae bacterium]